MIRASDGIIYFKPDKKYSECTICGIQSFAHHHLPNTKPRDYIIDDVYNDEPTDIAPNNKS